MISLIAGADPGFQIRGGVHLKKIVPSGGRCEKFWGISCEKSRFYAKKSYFFQFQGGRGAHPPPWIGMAKWTSNFNEKSSIVRLIIDSTFVLPMIKSRSDLESLHRLSLDHTQVNLTNCLLTLLNMCAVCYLECTCVNRQRQGFTLLSVYKETVLDFIHILNILI